MEKLTLALDWTPNINHIGFFVALEKDFYENRGINVSIIHPGTDDYSVTPAKKVELGKADFALCPTESIISYRTKSKPANLIAVAAVLQEDLSAIVVKEKSGIQSPKNLDTRTYASYEARYEDKIVKQMIRNDGGQGNIEIAYPKKLGIWDAFLEGIYDSTWVFTNWEGVATRNLEADLRYFKMKDYAIPYSYSPVIAARESEVTDKSESYRAFIEGSRQGFEFCKSNRKEAVEILSRQVPKTDAHIDLRAALDQTIPALDEDDNWGRMDRNRIQEFLDFIYENKMENKILRPEDIFTPELLD